MIASLDDQLAAARAVWPDLDVDVARFAAELARRLGAELTPELVASIRSDEVYVVIACEDGVPAAVAHVERECQREVEIAAGKLRASSAQLDDLRGQLRQILFVPNGDKPTALASFTGRGDLRGYLRVIATRELIRTMNRERRDVPIDDGVMLDRLVVASDPELSVIRRQYGAEVDAALRASIAALDDRGRALLRLYLIDDWSIDQIAAAYGVHRATSARWLVAIREGIGDQIRSELAHRLSLPVDEVSSIVRLLQSRLDVSFERALRANPSGPDSK